MKCLECDELATWHCEWPGRPNEYWCDEHTETHRNIARHAGLRATFTRLEPNPKQESEP